MTLIKRIGFRVKEFLVSFIVLSLFLCLQAPSAQALNGQFVTMVNPVRISSYTKDISSSLASQYTVVKNYNFSSTWLLTYDAVKNEGVLGVVNSMDKDQSFGVFLEVTPEFAESAGISYNETGNWHHASSVFLSGYPQEDRIKLIDKVFETFKRTFGYYPKVVGSWWTDAFSLSYMVQKYGIVANLGVSDQFSTDGYQIWGTPWSVPYYPSKYHSGVPANSQENKLNVVMLQWAPRDPLNGYKSSLYSTQDYVVVSPPLDTSYFAKLVELYAKKNGNQFGQVTVGLEADLDAEGYKGEFNNQMKAVKDLADTGEVEVVGVERFVDWYRKSFPELSPAHKIETEDFLESTKRVTWFMNPFYRAGVLYDSHANETRVFDVRIYDDNLTDPYYTSPNSENTLSINISSLIDEVSSEKEPLKIKGQVKMDFGEQDLLINGKRVDLDVYPTFQKFGEIYKTRTSESVHFFKRKRFILDLLRGVGWDYFKKANFFIPQDEILGLLKLSKEPPGVVLVFDNECLQCEYHTEFKHPAFANQRDYVRIYSKHPIVYNSSIFNPENKQKVKDILKRLRVKYIYLVKFEKYVEKLPFSPGDLGVVKIFSNANSEIWRVE